VLFPLDALEEWLSQLQQDQSDLQALTCGATMLMNSRDVITLVFFQNLGKCRWLPVTRTQLTYFLVRIFLFVP
jgi:hypothetical protein